MANLLKPRSCACGGTSLKHEFRPERWVCKECGDVCAERPQRNDPGKCRVCGAARGTKPFARWGHICLECKSDYNKSYGVANRDQIAEQHRESYQRDKPKRQAAVRRSIQRSPEAFITYLAARLRRPSADRMNPVIQVVEVDKAFLIDLYRRQGGLCALTGLPMTHSFHNPLSISVDRRDSARGYTKDNVQLVCQWLNHAKRHHSNDTMMQILDLYFQTRAERDGFCRPGAVIQ